jgi:hypothetical protein
MESYLHCVLKNSLHGWIVLSLTLALSAYMLLLLSKFTNTI